MRQLFKLQNQKIVPASESDASIALYVNPTEEERHHLIQEREIDDHTISSALDPEETARIEFEESFTAMIVKKPRAFKKVGHGYNENYQFGVSSLGIFIFEEMVIVISDNEFPFLSDRRFHRVTSLKSFSMQLIGYCTYHFMDHLRIMNQISDELETQISQSMENKYLLFMFSLSKGLVYYLDAINSNGMLLRRIGNGQRLALNETERELLEDISIDNQQSYRSAEIASDVLSTMMDARASVVNNNLNQLMKFLSVITFGVGMVTLVVSTFSMNVRIPLSQYDHAFWMVLGIAALALTLFFLFWRTRKW